MTPMTVTPSLRTKTDPTKGKDMSLGSFAGRTEGSGRLNLSTLHNAKGREFDAVILYGMNSGEIPSKEIGHQRHPCARPAVYSMLVLHVLKKELSIVYQDENHSPWVTELYQRSQQTLPHHKPD